jgi:hypothetical protein
MKTPVLPAIAAATFASSSLYLWGQLRAERDRGARVEETTRQLNARIAELEKGQPHAAAPRSANSGGFVTAQPGPGAAPAPPPAIMPPSGAGADGLMHWMSESPKLPAVMERAMRSQVRANNRHQYADFCEENGLYEATSDNLIALISEQEVAGFLPTGDVGEMQRQLEQRHRQHEAEIADLIGPEKAQALKQYQASLPARAEVEMLAQQLDGNDVLLTRISATGCKKSSSTNVPASPCPNSRRATTPRNTLRSAQEWQDDFAKRVMNAPTTSSIPSSWPSTTKSSNGRTRCAMA